MKSEYYMTQTEFLEAEVSLSDVISDPAPTHLAVTHSLWRALTMSVSCWQCLHSATISRVMKGRNRLLIFSRSRLYSISDRRYQKLNVMSATCVREVI